MKFLPIEAILKNGKTVTIRQASRKDARDLLHVVSKYIIDSEYLLTTIDEFNPTVQDEKRWIDTLNNNRNCLLLIATYQNKIIGNIDLRGELRKKTRHNAILGIGILKEWQGLGLGKILMQCAIDWARQSLSLETLWLHVFGEHQAAIALYKKMGFEIVSVQKNYIKNHDGTYSDDVMMMLPVNN